METPKRAYVLIRSKRRTMSLRVTEEGLVVRAPLRLPAAEIDRFVASKERWIAARVSEIEALRKERAAFEGMLGGAEAHARFAEECKARAKREIPARAWALAAAMGVRPVSVRVGSARTRWGSCNAKGCINFSWRIIFADRDTIDYVIIHELAHLKHLNHSKAFWGVVARYMPDYGVQRAKLRELHRRLQRENW